MDFSTEEIHQCAIAHCAAETFLQSSSTGNPPSTGGGPHQQPEACQCLDVSSSAIYAAGGETISHLFCGRPFLGQ